MRFVDHRPSQHVIVAQAQLIVLEALRPRIQHEKRIAATCELVIEHLIVRPRPVAPLIIHVCADRDVEEQMLRRLSQAVLRPVVLDFVIIEDHVGRRLTQ